MKIRIEIPDGREDGTGAYLCHPDDAGNCLYIYPEGESEPVSPRPADARLSFELLASDGRTGITVGAAES